MKLHLWVSLTWLLLIVDNPTHEQEFDDEVSYIQQGLTIHSVRFNPQQLLKQRADVLAPEHIHIGNQRAINRTRGSVKLDASSPVLFRTETLTTTDNLDVLNAPPELLEQKHIFARYVVMPLALVAMGVFTMAILLEKYEFMLIPETALMIAIGMALGVWAKTYGHFEFFDSTSEFGESVYETLNMLLLPIIIFSSGWSLRRQDFFSQFPYILLFAIMGVVLSASVISSLIYITGAMGLHNITGVRTALAYATLISATDPVSVLVTYQKLKVDPLLNILVYGEATINDAVAIVLFHVLNHDWFMLKPDGHSLSGWKLMESVSSGVVVIFFGSFLIGFLCACLYALIAHMADMRINKKCQILMLFASCYLTYAIAESCGKSGIIANLFCGIFSGIYLRPHLSEEGSLMATFFLQQLAMLAEATVFVLVGVCVVNCKFGAGQFYFAMVIMGFCMMGRFFAVIPLGLLTNYCKRLSGQARGVPQSGWNLLTCGHMFMMWHAGLRGGIAIALSMELGRWVDKAEGSGTRNLLQTATFTLVGIFLLIFGGTTTPCLRILGIRMGEDAPPDHLSQTEGSGPIRDCLVWMDRTILAPALIGRNGHAPAELEQDVEDVLRVKSAAKRAMPTERGRVAAATLAKSNTAVAHHVGSMSSARPAQLESSMAGLAQSTASTASGSHFGSVASAHSSSGSMRSASTTSGLQTPDQRLRSPPPVRPW